MQLNLIEKDLRVALWMNPYRLCHVSDAQYVADPLTCHSVDCTLVFDLGAIIGFEEILPADIDAWNEIAYVTQLLRRKARHQLRIDLVDDRFTIE